MLAKYGALSLNAWHDRAASQLMIHATFGPTRAGIASLSSQMQSDAAAGVDGVTFQAGVRPPPSPPAITQWVVDQITTVPVTLHRAYLRQRANPRQTFTTDMGRPRGACEVGARWNRIAIRGDDLPMKLEVREVAVSSGTVTAMYIGPHADNMVLRSEVDLSALRPWGGITGGSAPSTSSCQECQSGTLVLNTPYTICTVHE